MRRRRWQRWRAHWRHWHLGVWLAGLVLGVMLWLFVQVLREAARQTDLQRQAQAERVAARARCETLPGHRDRSDCRRLLRTL